MIAPPAPDPPLSYEVIALRPYTEADVDELTAALQDPEIAAWTNVPAPYTRGQALRFVTEGPANITELALGIRDAGDDRLLGSSGVRFDDLQRCVEIGYGWPPPSGDAGWPRAPSAWCRAGRSRSSAGADPRRSRQRGLATGGRAGRLHRGGNAAGLPRPEGP